MLFSWFTNRRRKRLLTQPYPQDWLDILRQNIWHYRTLSAADQMKLRDDLRIFIDDKYWEGAGDLDLTEEMQVTISGLACLLTLHLDDHDYFKRVRTILVYPNAFVAPQARVGAGGIVSEGFVNSGEAWFRGPVIISWPDALAGGRGLAGGRSLVLHEFAHALDMMNGLVDGTPALASRHDYARWHGVMTAEYERLRFASEHGLATLLNQYGATNVAEFFAVATECFFEQAPFMRQWHPALYQLLRDYYRQDPAARPI